MHAAVRPFYSAFWSFARGLAHLPWPGDGKLARSVRARREATAALVAWGRTHRDPARPLLWMHAPSVGEGLQAKPVIERLRAQQPELHIVYTHFSPSAERFAASIGADFAGYLPFDRAADWDAVLAAVRPTALVFAKLDVWPLLVERAARSGVPMGMISATLAETSGRRGPLSRAVSRDAFATLDAVGAIDAADAERLVAIGVRADCVRVTGDTRYDQVLARTAAADRSGPLLAPLVSARPTLVAGSTWPSDEAVLLPSWLALRAEVPTARLIIAPHEPTPTHLEPLRRQAADARLTLRTLDAPDARDADVVLVDRVGVLGDLYALADVAFVGGAFHAAGLHSVLEPAAYGVPVLFGPRHAGARDARLLLEARGAAAAHDVATLTDALRIVFTEADARGNAGRAAREVVQGGSGAAERSTALVMELLARRESRRESRR